MDVSGRHEEAGEYLMVAAAVHASVGSARIEAVEGHLGVGPGFKYVESVAERQTVQAAHHAAYAARRLVL